MNSINAVRWEVEHSHPEVRVVGFALSALRRSIKRIEFNSVSQGLGAAWKKMFDEIHFLVSVHVYLIPIP